MKGKRLTKLLALLVAALMAVFVSLPAMADGTSNTYTSTNGTVAGTTTTFKKYLVVRAGETNPDVTFSFTVSVPDSNNNEITTAGSEELQVKPGVGTPVVSTAQFDDGEANLAKDNNVLDPTEVSFTDYTYGVKDVTVDFSSVTFTEPGVYRYYITENDNNTAFGIDSVAVRTLDVYIEDNGSGKLQVAGYVMYKGQITDNPKKDKASTKNIDDVPNGAEAGEKSNKFINTYPTNSLTINKTVTGNQGSKDKYFKFTIKASSSNLVATAQYPISGLDANPVDNSANSYAASDMKTQNNITYLTGTQLTTGYEVYLQHNDVVKISGLPIGCTYTITETQEEYTPSWKIVRDAAPTVEITSGATNVATDVDPSFPENTTVSFTNEKTGVIPTGVIVSAAGLLVVGVIAIIGFVFFGTRSKRRYEED
ncbi:MAG: hypothetical protein IKH94_02725 [Eubacterium sp.]|nr:hypothetical protein [Eubacterium sp.]